MHGTYRLHLTVVLLGAFIFGLAVPPALAQETTCLPVPLGRAATACIRDARLDQFWGQQGGLPVFGYPVRNDTCALTSDTRRPAKTQWLERNRFELRPDDPPPYDVLLGRLGDDRLRQLGHDWTTFPKAAPDTPHYAPQTGHAIAAQFWTYWSGHGLEFGDPGVSDREALALFGYPLSEPTMETNSSGDTVLTQWFERARFEYHPEKPASYQVLLGLLGSEILSAQLDHAQAQALSLVTDQLTQQVDGNTYMAEMRAMPDACYAASIAPETRERLQAAVIGDARRNNVRTVQFIVLGSWSEVPSGVELQESSTYVGDVPGFVGDDNRTDFLRVDYTAVARVNDRVILYFLPKLLPIDNAAVMRHISVHISLEYLGMSFWGGQGGGRHDDEHTALVRAGALTIAGR